MSFEQEFAREPAGQKTLPLIIPSAPTPRPLLLRYPPYCRTSKELSPPLSLSPTPPDFLQVKINLKKKDFKIKHL